MSKKELTHTLTGVNAAAAKILEEVREIFHTESGKDRANRYEAWRLEYYIMEIMCSPMNIWVELKRSNIEAMVALHFTGYSVERQGKARYDTAFRRLVRKGFLYGVTRNNRQFDSSYGKQRCYGVALDRYDTDEVAA